MINDLCITCSRKFFPLSLTKCMNKVWIDTNVSLLFIPFFQWIYGKKTQVLYVSLRNAQYLIVEHHCDHCEESFSRKNKEMFWRFFFLLVFFCQHNFSQNKPACGSSGFIYTAAIVASRRNFPSFTRNSWLFFF